MENEGEVDKTLNNGERKPNLYDYVAGAMLASGFVWTWAQVLPYLLWVPQTLLVVASYVIYLSGGIVASYLVCRRASSRHLFVGIKLAALTWGSSVFTMLSIVTEPTVELVVALLVIFVAGGVAGAYLALRSALRLRRVQSEASEDV